VEYQVRNTTVKPTPNDFHRRLHALNEENVQILDLDKLKEIEEEKPVVYPRKKKTLLQRFISLFNSNDKRKNPRANR
jgi:hypothetical protein